MSFVILNLLLSKTFFRISYFLRVGEINATRSSSSPNVIFFLTDDLGFTGSYVKPWSLYLDYMHISILMPLYHNTCPNAD